MDVEHACHCTYRIRYHMVCVVKYRKKLLLEHTRIEFLKAIMLGLSERYYLKFDAIGIDGDHFHVVVGAAPRYSPSQIISIIKSWSARLIFQKYPSLKKYKHLWNRGTMYRSIGSVSSETVKHYIEKSNSWSRTKQKTLN